MSKFKDLTGQKFGRLTVIERAGYKYGRTAWLCRCSCGNPQPVIVTGHDLNMGRVKSCGCILGSNNFDISGSFGIGYTNKNEKYIFDRDDFELINNGCWYVNANGYLTSKRNNKAVLFHRIVTNCPDNMKVDHINHNKLDNRKSNLRICTDLENSKNKGLRKDNKSGVTGVRWDKQKNKWTASIRYNNNKIYLGGYDDFAEAVKIRKEAEEKYFGEWSHDNSQKISKENDYANRI